MNQGIGMKRTLKSNKFIPKDIQMFTNCRVIACLSAFGFMISLASAGEKTVTTKISAVDADKNAITFGGLDLNVTRKTTITILGKKATLADLKKGQEAKVTYEDSLDAAISIAVLKEAVSDDDATAKAMKALQGEWKVIAGIENGKKQERNTIKTENRRFTIKGNSLSMSRVIEQKLGTYVGKFEIDASTGHFDWVGKRPGGQHVEWIGIYELEGDILKLCFIYQRDDKAKRPKEFKSLPPIQPGMAHLFYTLKRDTDE